MSDRRPFRFGVINETPLQGAEFACHVRRIEELGYSTYLIRDHFVPDFFGDQLAPVPAMMAAAAATTTLRVGTLVLDNDFRHPVMLAKEAATIDVLSGGRLELGIGAGWLRREYDLAGIDYDRAGVRISRLEESLNILKGLLAGGAYSFAGEHYDVADLDNFPKPVQRPRPPILVGGGKPRMLRLAGREADIISLLTTSVATGTMENDPTERLAASVEQKLGWIREGAGERFHQIELNLIPSIIYSEDREKVAADMVRDRGWTDITPADVLEMPSILIGTCDEIVDQMRQRRERYGFSYFVFSDSEMQDHAPIVSALAGT